VGNFTERDHCLPMMVRLALQPPWVRFLVLAPVLAALFGAATSLPLRHVWYTAISAIFFGVVVAGIAAYGRNQAAQHEAMVEAVAGLDKSERSEAIAAVTRGIVPTDPTVRSAASRLGSAFLRHKSAGQLN
jgi:hypothetical protein